MDKKVLFIFYFIFLWGEQLSSTMVSLPNESSLTYLMTLYFCLFCRAILWFLIIREMELVKAYTISSLNYIFMPFLSFILLNEVIQIKYFVGAIFIIIGIYTFSRGEKS